MGLKVPEGFWRSPVLDIYPVGRERHGDRLRRVGCLAIIYHIAIDILLEIIQGTRSEEECESIAAEPEFSSVNLVVIMQS